MQSCGPTRLPQLCTRDPCMGPTPALKLSPTRSCSPPFPSSSGRPASGAIGSYNYLADAVLSLPRTRAMYMRRLRTLMDEFTGGRLAGIVTTLHTQIREEAIRDNAKWGNSGNPDTGYQCAASDGSWLWGSWGFDILKIPCWAQGAVEEGGLLDGVQRRNGCPCVCQLALGVAQSPNLLPTTLPPGNSSRSSCHCGSSNCTMSTAPAAIIPSSQVRTCCHVLADQCLGLGGGAQGWS